MTTNESTDIHRLLSDHFTLFELVRSVRAELLEMDNLPEEKQIKNLSNLCRHILEPTRIALGDSIYITSGYRTREQNRIVGGVKNSKHIMGLAADRGMDLVWYTPTRRCEFDPVEMGLGLKCCSAARVNVTIEPDGTVLPCQSWFESMGNILEDPWDAIWNSELARAIRAKAYMPASCEGCEHEDNCTAGCPLERDGKGCSPLG